MSSTTKPPSDAVSAQGALFGNITNLRPERAPDFLIGQEIDGVFRTYMERWYMIPRNPEFNIYYHRIVHGDDDRALHDHPWASVSVMCAGAIREHTNHGVKEFSAGDVVFREPNYTHRLELIDNVPCETMFITGPKVREWGFHCPKGFVMWKDFVQSDQPGMPGRGCGEMA
jgi:quercetin dioxygenase-like cupin family protein